MTSQMADHVAKVELEPLRGSVEAVAMTFAIVVVGTTATVLVGAVTVIVTVAVGIVRPH